MNSPSYWTWLSKGTGGRRGFQRVLNGWIVVHLGVGIGLAFAVKLDLATCADAVLLPLAGILVGLSFAWAGNAQALLQTPEMEKLAEHHRGGYPEYVYIFQTAILTILWTLVFWALAGLRLFDDRWPTSCHPKWYLTVKAGLFVFSSLTIRECWHVVLGAQLMLIARWNLRLGRAKTEADRTGNDS